MEDKQVEGKRYLLYHSSRSISTLFILYICIKYNPFDLRLTRLSTLCYQNSAFLIQR